MTADQSRSWRGWSALVLIVIAIGAMRLRLASISLERDEGEYAYAGQLLLRGVPPYQSAYNMKFPGTYVMYAVILDTAGRIWGQTPTALRVGVAVVNAADLILVFALSRRFWTPAASIAAAATFGLLSLNQGAQAIMGHATHFVLLPAMAGLWFLIPAKDDPASEWLLSKVMLRCAIGGLFLALAILMKQPGIFFAPFGYFLVGKPDDRPSTDSTCSNKPCGGNGLVRRWFCFTVVDFWWLAVARGCLWALLVLDDYLCASLWISNIVGGFDR